MGPDIEREIDEARRSEPRWDDLRERRVLARTLGERAERAARRRRIRIAAGAGVVIAAGIALAIVGNGRYRGEGEIGASGLVAHGEGAGDGAGPEPEGRGVDEELERTRSATAPPERSDPLPGRIALRDGSEVELGEGARVEVAIESELEVRLAQRAGVARYVVSHRPERSFVVVAGEVEVAVRGTQFTVRLAETSVEVAVEQGRVEVRRASETRALAAGEAMRLPIVQAVEERGDVRGGTGASADARRERSRDRATPTVESEGDRTADARSIEAVLAEADEARRAGRLDDAARALRVVIDRHRSDPRAATALFTLARVERGRDAVAAETFERAYAHDPGAVLAEDALAEAAVSWAAAGSGGRARTAAQRYLALHPSGQYAERVRPLAE
jgi:transmembrane sensor